MLGLTREEERTVRALVLGRNITLIFNVVWALGAAGMEADVICDWFAPRVRYSRHCRHYTRVASQELSDIRPAFVQKLKSYCRSNDIDIVIPADLGATLGLARVPGNGLRLFPFASPPILESLHDKWRFHQLLKNRGLPSPHTRLLDQRLAQSAAEQTYPLLIKPALGEGSRDITRCDGPEQLARLWQHKLEHEAGPWLAQELIPGHDIDLSLLADHGRVVAHTIQQDERADTKRFVEDERMLNVASEIVRATEFHGLAHFDMRIDSRDDNLYVIECNPRVWGSLMYSVWAGVNFIELGVRMAMGQTVPTVGAPTEQVWHQGVAPRRLLEALLHGRTAPEGMRGATLASWRQAHKDPLTQLVGGFTEPNEDRLRRFFSTTYEAAKHRALHS